MKKYYRLRKDLPTFDKGELFYMDNRGSLIRLEDNLMAYFCTTVAKFPNILEEWFEPTHPPIRDEKTRELFIGYLENHPNERFFQAVRNFTRRYLNTKGAGVGRPFIIASDLPPKDLYEEDTFHWECDEMLEGDDEIQS